MTRRYLSVPEAAEYLGITQAALRMMVQKRNIIHIKDGRRVRFDVRDLDAHMHARRVPTGADR